MQLNRSIVPLRKVIKTKGAFPNDTAILKILSCPYEHSQKMDDANLGLEGCLEPVCDSVRWQIRTVINKNRLRRNVLIEFFAYEPKQK